MGRSLASTAALVRASGGAWWLSTGRHCLWLEEPRPSATAMLTVCQHLPTIFVSGSPCICLYDILTPPPCAWNQIKHPIVSSFYRPTLPAGWCLGAACCSIMAFGSSRTRRNAVRDRPTSDGAAPRRHYPLDVRTSRHPCNRRRFSPAHDTMALLRPPREGLMPCGLRCSLRPSTQAIARECTRSPVGGAHGLRSPAPWQCRSRSPETAARSSRAASPLLRVLKCRQRFQLFLGRPRQHQLAPLDLELPCRNGHVVPVQP